MLYSKFVSDACDTEVYLQSSKSRFGFLLEINRVTWSWSSPYTFSSEEGSQACGAIFMAGGDRDLARWGVLAGGNQGGGWGLAGGRELAGEFHISGEDGPPRGAQGKGGVVRQTFKMWT